MSSLLNSCRNTRSILPDNLKYLRSDVPANLSDEEIDWLLENNIRCIIDLRSEEEQAHKPCSLRSHPDFCYHSLPVSGGNAVPDSPDKVSLSYMTMVDEQMEHIIHTIEHADCGVLYYCNAGEDRTGVVSAILLRRTGFDDDYIIADYLLSEENLRDMLHTFAASNPDINLEVITPQRRYIEEFLEQFQTK